MSPSWAPQRGAGQQPQQTKMHARVSAAVGTNGPAPTIRVTAAAVGRRRRGAPEEPAPLSDTSRRILLRTSRRSSFSPQYAGTLSDETRYIDDRQHHSLAKSVAGLPSAVLSSVIGATQPHRGGGFLQSRAGVVFMTASWMSYLIHLYDTATAASSWLYPMLHAADGLNQLPAPLYYATTASLLLANSYVMAYLSEVAGQFVDDVFLKLRERVTGQRSAEVLRDRRVPVQEPSHGPQRPDEPYAAFQRPLFSTAMPLQGPTIESIRPGEFLRTHAGVGFLAAAVLLSLTYLYNNTESTKWYFSMLHTLDGLEQLTAPAYYVAVTMVILAYSYIVARVADKLAYHLSGTLDVWAKRLGDRWENARFRAYVPSVSVK